MTPAARLRCTESHIAAVRRMVEEDAPSAAVLLQLRAVQGSLRAVARLLLAEEIRRTAREGGVQEAARLVERMAALMVGPDRRRPALAARTPHHKRRAP